MSNSLPAGFMILTWSHGFINVQQLCSVLKKKSLYCIPVVLPVVFKLTFGFIRPPRQKKKCFLELGMGEKKHVRSRSVKLEK